MKWFEHDVDMHTDLKIQNLMEKYGLEGYAIWCLCLEMVGKEGEKGRLMVQTRWQQGLLKITGWSDKGRLDEIINFMAEIKLICSKSLKYGNLYIPNFIKRIDDYAKRKLRTTSEQDTEKIALPYNTRHNITIHYIQLKGWEEKNLVSTDYSLINKGINKLWARSGGDEKKIMEGLDWLAKKNWDNWSILALDKWWAEFMKPPKKEIRYD